MVSGSGVNQTFSVTMPLNPTRIRSIESDPDLQQMIEQLNRYIHELDYLGTTNDTQEQTKTHYFSFHSIKEVYLAVTFQQIIWLVLGQILGQTHSPSDFIIIHNGDNIPHFQYT